MTDPTEPRAGRPSTAFPRHRTLVVVALLAVGIVLIAGSIVSAGDRQQDPGDRTAGEPVDQLPPDPLAGLEAAVEQDPEDAQAWATLGAAYVDHARVNSEPSAYPKAERALERSLAIDDDGNWEALAAMGALAAGRHDFSTALRYSEQARDLQPQSSFIRGVIVDSLTELGRYPEAVEAAQAMVDLRPDLASYARVSYQRELHGDVPGAIEAMDAALRASASPGDRAFARYFLGELEWGRGDVDRAASHYEAALQEDPEAVQALAGLGKVSAARGDTAEAIRLYEEAVLAFPDPEVLKELGELHLVHGDEEAAQERFRQSAEENAAQAAGGVYVDLETALFTADHREDLDAGLAAAEREWERRHSVHVADALAWQLLAHDRPEEALTYANAALRIGTQNASFYFHRAEIHRALGDLGAARADYEHALSVNPNFSYLHADAAERRLAELREPA